MGAPREEEGEDEGRGHARGTKDEGGAGEVGEVPGAVRAREEREELGEDERPHSVGQGPGPEERPLHGALLRLLDVAALDAACVGMRLGASLTASIPAWQHWEKWLRAYLEMDGKESMAREPTTRPE